MRRVAQGQSIDLLVQLPGSRPTTRRPSELRQTRITRVPNGLSHVRFRSLPLYALRWGCTKSWKTVWMKTHARFHERVEERETEKGVGGIPPPPRWNDEYHFYFTRLNSAALVEADKGEQKFHCAISLQQRNILENWPTLKYRLVIKMRSPSRAYRVVTSFFFFFQFRDTSPLHLFVCFILHAYRFQTGSIFAVFAINRMRASSSIFLSIFFFLFSLSRYSDADVLGVECRIALRQIAATLASARGTLIRIIPYESLSDGVLAIVALSARGS